MVQAFFRFFHDIRYGFIIVASVLMGCTNLQVSTPPQIVYTKQSWQQRHRVLTQINQWNMAGAFSIRQPNKNIIAAYEWQQRDQSYNIRIYGSLDAYSIRITGRPGLVMLWRSPEEHFTANSPEQLMQQQLGWRLPLSNLFYWMRGLPAPGNYQADFDRYGHLTLLSQMGWQVHYANYVSVGSVDLPQILELTQAELYVKIVIKRWKI